MNKTSWQSVGKGILFRRLGALALGLCLLGRAAAGAATYYVAPTGNDTNAGSLAAPWKTVNHAAQTVLPGDTCNIMAGTYRETAVLARSGTAAAPITFQPYGTDVPVISGLAVVSGTWASDTNQAHVWNLSLPGGMPLGTGNQMFVNGAMAPEARIPHHASAIPYPWQDSSTTGSADWHRLTAATCGYTDAVHGTGGWVADSTLPTEPAGYWTNAYLHIMSGYGWVMACPQVTSSSSTTIGGTATTQLGTGDGNGLNPAAAFTSGNEFYVTGKKALLGAANEWYYDGTNTLSVYANPGPPSGTIEVKQRAPGLDLTGRSYVTVKGLHFFGCTIKSSSATTYCTFDGVVLQYPDHSTLPTAQPALVLGTGCVLRNSDLSFDSCALVGLAGDNIRLINNTLHDAGYVPNWTAAVDVYGGGGSKNLVSHNTLHDTGRAAMGFPGRASVVEYNDMHHGMRMTSDGGILYTYAEAGNTVVRYNIFHDAPGPAGHLGNPVEGLYLDNQSSSWVIHHNAIWNVPGWGLQLNNRQDFLQVFNNSLCQTQGLLTASTNDGDGGTHFYNNILGAEPDGEWTLSDFAADLTTQDPLYTYPVPTFSPLHYNFQLLSGSPAIDTGTAVPGVTDGYSGAAPDIGAFESGGTYWISLCGANATPPSPDPAYTFPAMAFANQIVDGSFEATSPTTLAFSSSWTVTSATAYKSAHSAWTDENARSGVYSAQFAPGATGEVAQTVTGLQPNSRYTFFAGVNLPPGSSATLGVKNFGLATVTAPASPSAGWQMVEVPFTTGPSATSAQVYLDVTVPTGGGVNAFADDFGVELNPFTDAEPGKPLFAYSFDETTGTVAHDSGLNGWNGTVAGGAAWTAGKLNNALQFDGSTGKVTTPSFPTPSEITAACWAKSGTATWNDWNCLLSKEVSFVLSPYPGTKDVRFMIFIGGVAHTVDWAPGASEYFDLTGWHHYVGTYSFATHTLSLYVDGELRVSRSSATEFTAQADADSGPLVIGHDDSNSGRFFNGAIDDVHVYDRALDSAQVKALYRADASQIVRYRLDDGAGTTAWDASGSGLNGTLSAGTTWATDGQLGGGAAAFNGTTGNITSPGFATPTAVTAACWARSTDTSTNWNATGCFISKEPSFVLMPIAGTKTVRFHVTIAGITYDVLNTPTFDIHNWHHYAGVYEGSSHTFQLYVDGKLTGYNTSFSSPMDPDSGPVVVGQDDGIAGRFFHGEIDDVRIYKRVLNAAEILEIARQKDGLAPYAAWQDNP